MDKKNLSRNSGIELLKILAILLIVTYHIVQTLQVKISVVPYQEYILDLSKASTDISRFILDIFCYFGSIGNTIFFICSAWFLLSSAKVNKIKWFRILFEVWFVSVFILAVVFIIRGGDISRTMLLKSLFPTTFANNWYLTCYLLFYPIHPLLNHIINKLDKKGLFRISLVMFILYSCFDTLQGDLFFPSSLILWTTIYFIVAYIKKYLPGFADSTGKNALLLLVGIVGLVGMQAVTVALALSRSGFNVLHWAINCNPFAIIISIAMFNLMRRLTFKNKVINYISSLSLLIYIIHENLILRTYYRPLLWNYIYENPGYDRIVLWTLMMMVAVFGFALICAVIYDLILRKLILKLSDMVYSIIRKLYLKLENRLI